MARVAITEFAAKKLTFGELYQGFSFTKDETITLPDGNYIVKVDVGIKKRGKQKLVRLNVAAKDAEKAAHELFSLGHERVVVEPMVPHDDQEEKYLAIDLIRDGALLIQSDNGGVDIEAAPKEDLKKTVIPRSEIIGAQTNTELAGVPLNEILSAMQRYQFSFLEINPYLVFGGKFIALDMAVEINSSRENKLPDWVKDHILHKKAVSEEEAAVLEQDARTQAALNLHTLNPNASILTLFSGGGASLVALDSLVMAGLSDEVINYSEYSGAPTRDETATYVATLLRVLFKSKASNKVILIAGGVANFTDVMATFAGIVDALASNIEKLKEQKVYICVRRGGPNQEAGLSHLRNFLNENAIPNDVNGPELSLGEVGNLVKYHT